MRTPQRQPWGRGRYFEPTEMDAEVVRRWAAIAATVVVAAVVAAAAACQTGRLAVGLAWVDSVPQVVADRKSVCAAPRPPDKMQGQEAAVLP